MSRLLIFLLLLFIHPGKIHAQVEPKSLLIGEWILVGLAYEGRFPRYGESLIYQDTFPSELLTITEESVMRKITNQKIPKTGKWKVEQDTFFTGLVFKFKRETATYLIMKLDNDELVLADYLHINRDSTVLAYYFYKRHTSDSMTSAFLITEDAMVDTWCTCNKIESIAQMDSLILYPTDSFEPYPTKKICERDCYSKIAFHHMDISSDQYVISRYCWGPVLSSGTISMTYNWELNQIDGILRLTDENHRLHKFAATLLPKGNLQLIKLE